MREKTSDKEGEREEEGVKEGRQTWGHTGTGLIGERSSLVN